MAKSSFRYSGVNSKDVIRISENADFWSLSCRIWGVDIIVIFWKAQLCILLLIRLEIQPDMYAYLLGENQEIIFVCDTTP